MNGGHEHVYADDGLGWQHCQVPGCGTWLPSPRPGRVEVDAEHDVVLPPRRQVPTRNTAGLGGRRERAGRGPTDRRGR